MWFAVVLFISVQASFDKHILLVMGAQHLRLMSLPVRVGHREYMESMLEQLQRRLQDTQQNLQQSCCDLQQLQAEHDTLLERHNKILQEGVAKEAELRER